MICIGHIKPDTDAVCAAIAAAHFMPDAKPAITEDINKETAFVLDYFKVPKPEIMPDISGQDVVMVDHNQTTQAPNGYDKANIVGIIDHHALQNATFVIDNPIEITMKPWGSTSSIIADYALKHDKPIPKEIAGVMLAAIISDTLHFQSPTTTEHDKAIGKKLAELAEIKDTLAFAKEMFKAKSDIANLPAAEIITLDYKNFTMGDKQVGIGVAETVEPEALLARKTEFVEAIQKHKDSEKLDYVFFFIVDVLQTKSMCVIMDDTHKTIAQAAFGGTVTDSLLDTGSRVSRKKELVPALQEKIS